MLGRPWCRIFSADNSYTYSAIYPGREERDGIDIIPSNDEADSVAGNIFFHTNIIDAHPAIACVCFLLPPCDFYFARQLHRDIDLDLVLLFLVTFLSHDVMTYTILGFWPSSLGLAGFVSPFFNSSGACLLPLRDGQRRCSWLGACPCSRKQYRLSLSLKLLPQSARLAVLS